MTKREAKRHACIFAADRLEEHIAGGDVNSPEDDEETNLKIEDALRQIIEELRQRGRRSLS